MSSQSESPKLQLAFRFISVLLILCLALAITVVWLVIQNKKTGKVSFSRQSAEIRAAFLKNKYPDVDFRKFYPDRSAEEIDALQHETFGIRYQYHPFVQFRPLPRQGKYVNIAAAGYRANESMPPWPPDTNRFNIFVFGGSTTFGYGVADAETLVSRLQSDLNAAKTPQNVTCYNFAAGNYFSTQERILFESLLLEGHLPDMVIFVDGLNDFYFLHGLPELTPDLHEFITPDVEFRHSLDLSSEETTAAEVKRALDRYAANLSLIDAIAVKARVGALFVAQPIPFFAYERHPSLYPFGDASGNLVFAAMGYPEFARRAKAGAYGERFLWAADIFENERRPVYCDGVHFSPVGNSILAAKIAQAVVNLLESSHAHRD